MNGITEGLSGEQGTVVTQEMTAAHLGSGGVDVFATPSMIALMEAAAVSVIDPHLPEGQGSVGVSLEIRHLAPTPVGARVRAQATVTRVDGRQVQFEVQAWDEHELIGEGNHSRYIVEMARFARRVDEKRAGANS